MAALVATSPVVEEILARFVKKGYCSAGRNPRADIDNSTSPYICNGMKESGNSFLAPVLQFLQLKSSSSLMSWGFNPIQKRWNQS